MSTTLALTDVNLIAERMNELATRMEREAAILLSRVRSGQVDRNRQLAALFLLEQMCDAVGAFSLVLIIRDALNGRGSAPGIELHEEDW